MPSNKHRLYVALYARGGPLDKYHWGLLVSPKTESDKKNGTQFHARERILGPESSQWFYEEVDVPLHAANMLLVRVIVAKVQNLDRLRHIMRSVPIRQGETGWNCIGWVKEALELLGADAEALGRHVIEWEQVREVAATYCRQKVAANRFRGTGSGEFDPQKPPTFDLITNTEIIP